MRCSGAIRTLLFVVIKHWFSCPWEVVLEMLPSLLSLTLLEELPWSDSPFPAVSSTAPLLTGGLLSWCHSVLLVDIMKNAEMSLSFAAKWTTWQRTAVSFLLSAYRFFLEETGTQDPSQGPFLEGDMDIKLPSIYSPLAVSHQPLLLQTPPCAFVLCPKQVISISSGYDFAEL